MTFRIARHTTDLQAIEIFYTSIVGLQKLGGFQNHDGYDGIFLGHSHQDWHLEFTSSGDAPDSRFDDDDCLVFYINSKIELAEIKDNLAKHKIAAIEPKNPYWKVNGLMIADPDGYKIIFALKDLPLHSDDELTQLVRTKNIRHWSDLLDYVKALPYGRNAKRDDFSLVLKEEQGTCSSKHAFLKKVAHLNHINNVKLIMGIYKMNHLNTTKIGNTMLENGLDYIPEAHCYLMINNRRYDLTSPNASIHHLIDDVLEEKEIEPEQVNIFKVNYHKDFIKKWIAKGATDLSFERVWAIREACISKLGE